MSKLEMSYNLFVNVLIPDILVNTLIVFARKRVLAMDFYQQNDLSLAFLGKQTENLDVRHVSVENTM